MSMLFLKLLINFFLSMKSSCPKRRVNTSTAPDFAAALCSNREYLGGEGGSVRKQWYLKKLLLLAHSCGERYSLQRRGVTSAT